MKMSDERPGRAPRWWRSSARPARGCGDEPVPDGRRGYSGGEARSAGPAASAPARGPAAGRCPAPRSATGCSSPSTSRRCAARRSASSNAQIGWLKSEPDAADPDRGPRRRARHQRVQHRARLEPRQRGAQLHGEPGRARQPDLDHHLWPRAAGGDLRGRELLRAEPPRCHGRDWRNRAPDPLESRGAEGSACALALLALVGRLRRSAWPVLRGARGGGQRRWPTSRPSSTCSTARSSSSATSW